MNSNWKNVEGGGYY